MVRVNGNTGEVEVFNDAGVPLWSGKPFGYAASLALPINGTNDCVVLCNPDAERGTAFQNLFRLSADGSMVWQAELPAGQLDDAYVSVQWSGPQLLANTWSAYRVQIDADSGRILNITFTK